MINAVLKAITNRATGFTHPALNTSGFMPARETPAAAAVRDFLQLRSGVDDYHVLNALQTINAFPEITRLLGEDATTYQLEVLFHETNTITGALMIADEKGPPLFQPTALEFPPARSISLEAISPTHGRLTYGSRVWVIPVRSAGADIFPAWPVELGLRGGIRLSSTWNTGVTFQAQLTPVRYPFDLVSEALMSSNDMHALLYERSLAQAFIFAGSSEERLAIVLLALALSNPAVFP